MDDRANPIGAVRRSSWATIAAHPGTIRASLLAVSEACVRTCQALCDRLRGRPRHEYLLGMLVVGLTLTNILSPILGLRGLSRAALYVDLCVGIIGVLAAMRELFVLEGAVQPATTS